MGAWKQGALCVLALIHVFWVFEGYEVDAARVSVRYESLVPDGEATWSELCAAEVGDQTKTLRLGFSCDNVTWLGLSW